ncbi:High-affinity branched-chain amino acid transport ATP-binding protein LivF [Xylophilus ampelinus]|uniref:ABC transporter ATP-binding protein n=1 Tax=Variovorax paradoxus TaxID=34073 RepID=A0A2W5QMF2_VARPD|nr:MAG: ABC transporter ATP-binding protein [Variovorax paradoxus]VTY40195.1 High-affinity branched-chain amino acid transport ATP-binding protein LivF [Xylophilus ampelinus]
MTDRALLQIRGLVCGYGQSTVLHGVDLDVREGEIVSLLGANGAGKTTMLSAISGLLPATAGSILFDGKEITNWPAASIVLKRLIQVPERRQLFSGMTVEDNLLLGAFHQHDRGVIQSDLEKCYEAFPKLAERKLQLARSMSGGEQQMLAIARAMMARPRLLLLDEPSLGLAPIFVNAVLELTRKLRDQGCTVLLVEQNARAALAVSDRGYVLAAGRIVTEGTAADLLSDSSVQEAYLGNESAGEGAMEARIRAFAAQTSV